MEQLKAIITKIIKKYSNIELEEIIDKKKICLQFYTNNRYYRTLEITKITDSEYKVEIIPINVIRNTDFTGVIDVIYTLEKYSTAKEYTWIDIVQIKKRFIQGTRIELIKMYDYMNPVPSGTRGVVDHVDEMGTIHMKWENEGCSGLLVGIDEFRILGDDKDI